MLASWLALLRPRGGTSVYLTEEASEPVARLLWWMTFRFAMIGELKGVDARASMMVMHNCRVVLKIRVQGPASGGHFEGNNRKIRWKTKFG